MNLILDTLEKKPKEAKRLIGISYEQFLQLVNLAKQLHLQIFGNVYSKF